MKIILKKYISLLLIVLFVATVFSGCSSKSKNVELNADDIVVTYEFLGVDKRYESDYPSKTESVFYYRIKVTNNSKYRLENPQTTIYLENEEPIKRQFQEGYISIAPNSYSYSLPVRYFLEKNINGDEVYEQLKNTKDDIFTCDIKEKNFEFTGEWVDLRGTEITWK